MTEQVDGVAEVPAADPAPSADTAQPAPASPPASTPPADDPTPPPADPAPKDPADPAVAEYKIPDEFKDKPWASKIKSESDLWKQLENLNGALGKKQVVPDFKTATPKEIEDWKAQTRPADKAAYEFDPDTAPEVKEALATMLHSEGITAPQANAVVKGFQEMQKAQIAEMQDPKKFDEMIIADFGSKEAAQPIARALKANLNESDFEMLESLPNQAVGMVYRAVANILKGYGIEDSGKGGAHSPAPMSEVDLDAEAAAIFSQIQDLDKRAHSADERAVLVNKRQAIFERKAQLISLKKK